MHEFEYEMHEGNEERIKYSDRSASYTNSVSKDVVRLADRSIEGFDGDRMGLSFREPMRHSRKLWWLG